MLEEDLTVTAHLPQPKVQPGAICAVVGQNQVLVGTRVSYMIAEKYPLLNTMSPSASSAE